MKFISTTTPVGVLQETASRHRLLRKAMKLSQQELAERSGVSLGSLKRFERTGQISFESLLKLAHVLNRLDDFDVLFKANDEMKRIEHLFSAKTKS